MKKIKNIVFDLGNVLIGWDPHRLYKRFFDSEHQIEVFLKEINFYEWNTKQDAGRSFREGVLELSLAFPQYASLIEAYDIYWEESLTHSYTETIKIVHSLNTAGWPLYLLSNFSSEKFKLVQKNNRLFEASFFNLFHDLVISGDYGVIKPAPQIFHILLERNNLVSTECLFIDDSLANIETAQQLGFSVIHFQSATQLQTALKKLSIKGI